MQLRIDSTGRIRCLYCETVNLAALGRPQIARGSHVEPDHDGHWGADLAPVGGPSLGPFPNRSDALAAEEDWLVRHWLFGTP